MLETVTTVNEIELAIRDAAKILRISVLPIPRTYLTHLAEQRPVQAEWVWFAPDVERLANKITIDEIGIRQTPGNRFAALFHLRSTQINNW